MSEEDQHVMLYEIEGKYYAVSNICSHAQLLLSKGRLRDKTVPCPLHSAQFEVTTERCLGAPDFQNITSFPVQEKLTELIITC